jgi:hypothetical protein
MPPINEDAPVIPTSGELQTLPTVVSDTDMIVRETHTQNRSVANKLQDYIPTDPSKMIIKVWQDGQMKDYRETVSMVRDTVEKVMSALDLKGYRLLNV